MKKFLMVLLMLSITFPVWPLDISDLLNKASDKLPEAKQGVGYSMVDSEFIYLSTIQFTEYKDFNFEYGFADEDSVIGAISMDGVKAKDYITIPILKEAELNLGAYAGWKRLGITSGNNEFDWGISATAVALRW